MSGKYLSFDYVSYSIVNRCFIKWLGALGFSIYFACFVRVILACCECSVCSEEGSAVCIPNAGLHSRPSLSPGASEPSGTGPNSCRFIIRVFPLTVFNVWNNIIGDASISGLRKMLQLI